MTKERFINLFKIEEAIVQKIEMIEDDLIINVIMSTISYAMGNNIREEELKDYQTSYIFKHCDTDYETIKNVNNIYNTYLVNGNIIFETNMGMITIKTKEILLKEE